MEGKRYPTFDEESSIDRCCEPAVAELAEPLVKSIDGVTTVDDWIDNLDWDRFPSFGPFSEEEAIDRINRFEEELARGEVKWISSEEAWQRLYEKHQWLTIMYTKKEWEASRITPFYHNVLKDAIVL